MLRSFPLILLVSQSFCLDESNALFKEVFEYHHETEIKAEFASQVVDIMYNSFRQWYFTITFCEFTYFENRILKYTENSGYGYNVMLINGCPTANRSMIKPKYNTHGETAYLVTSSDLNIEVSENVIDAMSRTGFFKPRSAVIFVVNTPVTLDRYFQYILMCHFELLWSRSITNSVLILKSNDILKMYAYNPFFREVKDITGIKNVSIYLSKQYSNLYGYELRLSIFRKIFVSDKTGPVRCDSNLAKTVIQFLNASCIPLPPRDDSTVGDLLENGTATGVTADLMDGYSDLELNSRILKNSYYGYIDTTYPLIQDELCFLVKKSDTQSTFTTTIKLITIDMLLLFIFTICFFIVIAIFVRKIETHVLEIDDKQSIGSVLVDLVKCFIRQTVDFNFVGPVFRCLVLLIIIYSLIVDCAIDGIITSAITYPRFMPEINSMDDLIKSNLTAAIHNRDFKVFNRSLSESDYEFLKNRMIIVNDKNIKEIIDNRKYQYATLLRKTDSQYICRKAANMDRGRPLFNTMTSCPLPCFIVYGLRYGSPYLPRLNYIMYHLIEAGIPQFWSRTEESNLNRNLVNGNKDKRALGLANVKEMFYVLLIGLFTSICVFILEVVLYKRIKMGK